MKKSSFAIFVLVLMITSMSRQLFSSANSGGGDTAPKDASNFPVIDIETPMDPLNIMDPYLRLKSRPVLWRVIQP